MGNVHHLKIYTEYFTDVKNGKKSFEVRRNDRDYNVGDTLILNEYNSKTNCYTGAWVSKEITYKLDDTQFVKEGFVILGLADIKI